MLENTKLTDEEIVEKIKTIFAIICEKYLEGKGFKQTITLGNWKIEKRYTGGIYIFYKRKKTDEDRERQFTYYFPGVIPSEFKHRYCMEITRRMLKSKVANNYEEVITELDMLLIDVI